MNPTPSKRIKRERSEQTTSTHHHSTKLKRKNPIMEMPLEVLQNIFKFFSFQELGNEVRTVNRRFKLAVEDLLNKSFKLLGKDIEGLIAQTLSAIEATKDEMEVKCLCRLLNLLDIVSFHQSIVMATIWRYVYNKLYRTQRSCMYGGLILDAYHCFIHDFIHTPYKLYGPGIIKDYAIPDEVKRIVRLTKSFCVHFDKTNEESLKHALSLSGSKLIDLLDCAMFATRKVIFEGTNREIFSAKYCYFLKNAWFLAFGISAEKEVSSREKQRLMHLRMRRIAVAHTELFIRQHHYERELGYVLGSELRRPNNLMYTGYGDVCNTFFFYGVMNDTAYLQKFHMSPDQDVEDDEDEFDIEDVLLHRNNGTENDAGVAIPYLGLWIEIKLECPLAYAPYKYLYQSNNLFNSRANADGMYDVYFEFEFPGAFYSRLPPNFTYNKKVSTRRSVP